MVDRSWHLVSSQVDAWLLLKGELTRDDLTRLKAAAESVLSKPRPCNEPRANRSVEGRHRR